MIKILFFLFFLFGSAAFSFAALNLSVNAIDGGNSLRLDESTAGNDRKKEIRVRITSTDGKRYQIFQRMVDPMVNEKGQNLNSQALQVQTLANSNTSGTLYLQNRERLNFSEQLLYASAQNGESDSFIVGYFLDPQSLKTDGNFRGKLMFSARGTGDPSDAQALVDVFLENHSTWQAEVRGGHGLRQVRIKDSDTTEQTADFVKVSFSGNSGQDVRVYQEMESLPRNELGQELGDNALILKSSDTQGLRGEDAGVLKPTRTLIYSSRKAEDDFILHFLVNPDKTHQMNAGLYTGRIKYIVETDKGVQEYPIDLQLSVQSVFTMDVTPPVDGFSFNRVLPAMEPQAKEFTITVRSNLRKPYQVMQGFDAAMTNEKGEEFNSKYFTFKVEIPGDQKGKTRFADFSPVLKGENPVFSSDGNGSPVTFKLVYQLQGYPQMNSGKFEVPVRFSLNQN